MSGWKYLRPDEHEKAKEVIEKGIGRRIEVVIYFRSQHDEWSGLWSYFERTISLDAPHGDMKTIPLLPVFRERMRSLLASCWHECQHVGQDLLQGIRGLKEPAGLPSREIRQPGVSPSGLPDVKMKDRSKLNVRNFVKKRVEHPLRDVEFFPNLSSDLRILRRDLEEISVRGRDAFFKQWVGVSEQEVPSRYQSHSTNRLRTLRDKAPDTWKKVVAELWKAVSDLIGDGP